MGIYFTSDTHFGRERFFTEEFTNRSMIWKDAEEMDKDLIELWNSTVGEDDTVFLLGDYSDHDNQDYNKELWNKLNGDKKLILGNHDIKSRLREEDFPLGVVTFPSCITINIGDWEVFLSHYPCIDWNNKYTWNGNHHKEHAIQLYGHIHNYVAPELSNCRAYNVGVDVNDFSPISFEDILKRLKLT